MSRLGKALRRLRRPTPPVPVDAAAPVYRVAVTELDAIGCRLCAALRELLTFDWSTDPARMNRLMDEGSCFPAAPGIAFTRLDQADDVALFRMRLPPAVDPGAMPALWFRTSDLMIEGSNAAAASAVHLVAR